VGGNRYNHPELMKRIAELTVKADQVLPRDRSPVDEIAFVVDERSLCYQRVGDPNGTWLLLGQLPALQRIGAPVGHYLVSDLPQIGGRKLYLFATSFAPRAEDRRAIETLKRDGHVLVFLGTPGLYRDGRLDERGMFDLTGIQLKMSREPATLRVTLQPDAGSRQAAGEAGLTATTYGHDHRTFPIVYADDPEAKVLGTLADGRPGLVMKEHGTWTAVYSSAPLLPASLLRRLAQRAGVHLYLDTEDVVWASHDLLAVSVHRPGPRTIRLPRPADVSDLYEGSVMARGVDFLQADFPRPRHARIRAAAVAGEREGVSPRWMRHSSCHRPARAARHPASGGRGTLRLANQGRACEGHSTTSNSASAARPLSISVCSRAP
jgi:hypothetical protein